MRPSPQARPGPIARRWAAVLVAALVVVSSAALVGGCSPARSTAPGCQTLQRVALEAQAVPSASFVPCIGELPAGWDVSSFTVRSGASEFDLLSDRSQGRTVAVRLTAACDLTGAVPTPSRTPGVSSYLKLTSIDPRYGGTAFDRFPGGCISYRFSFQRGPHIALFQNLQAAVVVMSRHELRRQLHSRLGLELDP